MAVRVQLGGVNNNATDADAKRHNYPIFKAAKHPALKGAALLDIALPAKEAPTPKAGAEGSSPSKLGRKAGSVSKPAGSKIGGLKAKPELVKKSSQAAGEQFDAKDNSTHEEDPIAASLRGRNAAGGLNSTMKEADAKKQKVVVPAALALKSSGKDALIQFELPEPVAQPAARPVFTGIPAKSQARASNNSSMKEPVSAAKPKNIPVDENDPIDVAMRDRKQAGSVDTQISAADAKKQKLQLPQPVALSLDKPKENLLTVISNE